MKNSDHIKAMLIKVGAPTLSYGSDAARITASVNIGEDKKVLWFEVGRDYGK